jgi:hypothetical protein
MSRFESSTISITAEEANFLKSFADSIPTPVELPGGTYTGKDFTPPQLFGQNKSIQADGIKPNSIDPNLSPSPNPDPDPTNVAPSQNEQLSSVIPLPPKSNQELSTNDLLVKLSQNLNISPEELAQKLNQENKPEGMTVDDILGPWKEATDDTSIRLSGLFSFESMDLARSFISETLYVCAYRSHSPSKLNMQLQDDKKTYDIEVELYTLKTNKISRKDILIANYLNYVYNLGVERKEASDSSLDYSYYDYYYSNKPDKPGTNLLSTEEVQKFSMTLSNLGLPYQAFSQGNEDSGKKLYLKVPVAKLGEWPHPTYGTVKFDQNDFDQIQTNHLNNVLGFEPPLFLGHPTDYFAAEGAPAEAFLNELSQEEDVLFGTYEVVEEETYMDVVKGKFRYASAEIFREHKSKKSGEVVGTVLFGHALTNRPFVPDMPRVEALSETAAVNPQHFFVTLSLQDNSMPTNSQSLPDQSAPIAAKSQENLSTESKVPSNNTESQNTQVFSSAPTTGIENASEARLLATINALKTDFEQKLSDVRADAEAARAELRNIKRAEKLSIINALPLPAEIKEEYSTAITDGTFGVAEEQVLASLVKLSQTFSSALTTQTGVDTSNEEETLSQENPYQKTIERNKAASNPAIPA